MKGDSSSRPIDIADMSSSVTPLPDPPMSTLVTTSATIDESVPAAIGNIDAESGTCSEALHNDNVCTGT